MLLKVWFPEKCNLRAEQKWLNRMWGVTQMLKIQEDVDDKHSAYSGFL